MQNQIIPHKYKYYKPSQQKRTLAHQFSSAAGIGPQISALLAIDRIPALRYLSICRTMLFDSLKDQLIDGKNAKQNQAFDKDLIREVNLNSEAFRKLEIKPRNEDAFFNEVNAMIRLSLLLLYEELIAKDTIPLFLEGIKKMGESLEFVYGGDSDIKVFGEFDRFVEYVSNKADVSEETAAKENTIAEVASDANENGSHKTMSEAEEKNEDELLDRKQMIELLKISYPTLHDYIKKEIIPKPFYLGSLPRWKRADVMEFLKSSNTKI